MTEWGEVKEFDPRPRKGGWAPGDYLNKCRDCQSRFVGDKRAQQCADCAYAAPDPAIADKPARAPSEEALTMDRETIRRLAARDPEQRVSYTVGELDALLSALAAHRLSTALLSPQAVKAAARVYGPAAFIETDGWSEPEAAFQATVKAAQITHMQAAIRAAIEVATEHRISSALPVVEAARRHIRSFEPGTLSGSELNLACELRDMDGDIWEPWCVSGELVPMTDAELEVERIDPTALLNKRAADEAARADIERRVRALGYEPGALQAKWRSNPPPYAPTPEWAAEAELALLDALVLVGWIPAWSGDGTSCATQIIAGYAHRADALLNPSEEGRAEKVIAALIRAREASNEGVKYNAPSRAVAEMVSANDELNRVLEEYQAFRAAAMKITGRDTE